MNYNDAFAIQGVKKEHVDILNFTAGMIPVIWQYIKDVSLYLSVCTRLTGGQTLNIEKREASA